MSYKIYLVTHLDRNKKYVGITSKDLHQRWYQHMKDKASALHPDIATESHRMTMELIGEAETKQEALQMESELIQELGTEVPNGYNRQVRGLCEPERKFGKSHWVSRHRKYRSRLIAGLGELRCPVCQHDYTHMRTVEYFNPFHGPNKAFNWGNHVRIANLPHVGFQTSSDCHLPEDTPHTTNDAIRITFDCEFGDSFTVVFSQYKGQTEAYCEYWMEEDAS